MHSSSNLNKNIFFVVVRSYLLYADMPKMLIVLLQIKTKKTIKKKQVTKSKNKKTKQTNMFRSAVSSLRSNNLNLVSKRFYALRNVPVAYEVNVEVDTDVAAEYEKFLHGHVQRLLKECPGFTRGTIYQQKLDTVSGDATPYGFQQPKSCEKKRSSYTVIFRIDTRDHLDQFFKNKLPQLQAEVIEKFTGKLIISRRTLYPVEEYVKQ